ncbi:alpha/beta hydrolase [Alkaliphilus pronyensis]|uniref:Alpha/beta hydrolase n=1 Tax=Alkaliphilus pronyensis TaxID=1482732 RepID=A0A6I0FGE1_9FIRM|nr:alpha/beta hydrolase [Alkaliphilus pronyensis]KAB3537293.1 alpha/beta hydrolase [Alkaliphilus pronyensis]
MYSNNNLWKELQCLLPEKNRISEAIKPKERYIEAEGIEIHIDEYDSNSQTTIVVFHGVGGNGRLMSFCAVPLVEAGYNVICPDLPGYGFTKYRRGITYDDWIKVGNKIVENQLSKGKNVFIFGLSAGGMLAYNVACNHDSLKGLIFTNVLDNREEEVRLYSAKNKFQAAHGLRLLSMLPQFMRTIKVPIKMVTNMEAIVNNNEMLELLLKDKHGAGSSVSLNFLLSMMNSTPIVEPEDFNKVPVLMVHPGNDLWTPIRISELFFDKIAAPKSKVILENAGHFPIEEPGLTQMENAIKDFLRKYI